MNRRSPRAMPLRGHLTELYRRAVICAIGIVLGAVGGWLLADSILALLQVPVNASGSPSLHQLNFPTVSSAFDIRLQLAITVGIVVTCPLWIYQSIAFVAPALARRELGYTLGFTLSATVLFLLGAATGWIIVPHIVQLLLGFVPNSASAFIDARSYIDFVLKLMLATGVAFVLPVVLVLLNRVGVVSGRSLLRAWRWALVTVFAFTALVTPSADVLSMFLLALPMIGLYFAAVGMSLLRDRRTRALPDESALAAMEV